ncbi:MAG: glutaminase family protein [Planctomycetota bacterium]
MAAKVLSAFFIVTLVCGISEADVKESSAFRPPAVPLVTVDPYMSVWSFTDNLYDSRPVHWTGKTHAMSGMIRIDGKPYRFMGAESLCRQTVRQIELQVNPTQTTYRFQADGVELKLTFTTPFLPSDFRLLVCPVTFLSYEVRSLDNKNHKATIYFDISAEWVVNDPNQEVLWRRMPEKIAAMELLQFGSKDQPILAEAGDNRRIDWGYLYVGLPEKEGNNSAVTAANEARARFVKDGTIPQTDDKNMPQPANKNQPVIACTMNIASVEAEPTQRLLVLAYDDIYSIEYMHHRLRPWWAKEYGSFEAMFAACASTYPDIRNRCDEFDKELLADAGKLGGEQYARLISIAYRHTLASGKVVVGPDGQPWFFHKECFSNGCMATVDVSYPASPFFALFSPALLEGMTAPVFAYAASGKWPYQFAPHDVGRYPKGNGQAYHGTRPDKQMPVEECGNMILMTAAAAKAEGKAKFAAKHWKLLTQWAEYLKAKGLDPENQLCTDDFTGHLAHNANLSLKAINALGAYGMLCEMLGKNDQATAYRKTAQEMAAKWVQMANDGNHYRLTFDKPNTWSMKYNLVWDRLLGLNLFSDTVAQKEVAYYLKKQNKYGLPLDNRSEFTKSDWLVWSATLADSEKDFKSLIEPLYRFVQETPDRVPFTDWYWTHTGKLRGFRARPVIGGIFIKFLSDPELWQKWKERACRPQI